jgi:hypothetical protein
MIAYQNQSLSSLLLKWLCMLNLLRKEKKNMIKSSGGVWIFVRGSIFFFFFNEKNKVNKN